MITLIALFALHSLAIPLDQGPVHTKGTAPMAGGLGKIGQTYKISKEGMPMNFTVLSASFSVAPFNFTDRSTHMVDVAHKLLVIHYAIENPNTTDMYVSSWPLFQAVDSNDTTIPDSGDARRASDKTSLSMTIKPGQEISDIVTYIVVPADTFIPKLILKFPPVKTSYKVLRYMMGTAPNVIKGLPAPYRDPAEKTGSIARPQVPATIGTTYTIGLCDFSVDSIALVPGPLGQNSAADGKQFLVAKVTATNKNWAHFYYNANYKIALKTTDDKITNLVLMKGSQDANFESMMLEFGDTTTHRIVLQVPKGATLQTLGIAIDMGNEGITRSLVYDVSGVK